MKPLLVKFGIWKQSLGALAVLVALAVSTTLLGAPSVTMAWNPNSEPAVSGYKVSYGEASGNYSQTLDLGNATNATVSALVQGHTYYFAVSAYNASAVESDFSNEVKYTVPVGNSPPTANNISLATAEDTPTNMVLSGGDPDGDPLTYTVVKNPRHGTLSGQSPRLVY